MNKNHSSYIHVLLKAVNLLISESLLRDDVLSTLGRIEVDWEFDSLRLVDSERQVGLLLQILQFEALKILLCQSLGVEDASWWALSLG